MSAQDELTATICTAVRQLTQIKKAEILLNIALALIEDGQYGDEVEAYLDLYLKTPGLPKEDMEKALLAQSNAQKLGVGQLESRNKLPGREFSIDSACQRIPPEIWDLIATQTPRYHLRTWLFLSRLHREIASRHIFHTIDISFLDSYNRGLDILVHAIGDPVFASRVKSLRLYWEYEEGETSDLILRIVKISLPVLKALQYFEWFTYSKWPADTMKVLLDTYKHLDGVALQGWHTIAVFPFSNLRKFAFCANDVDGAKLGDIRTTLGLNKNTLEQLALGGRTNVDNSWDLVFESVTINNLTHLDLWEMDVSNFLVDRIAHAHNLQSLTVHGSLEDPAFASGMFATDRVMIDGTHTFLPHLESFRFIVDNTDEDLNRSVVHFIRKREKLRRLDLSSCPWLIVRGILPDLKNLKVLAVCVDELSQEVIKSLVEALPTQMVAIGLSVNIRVSDKFLDEYAHFFTCFNILSFLNLALPTYPKKPDWMSEKDFEIQMDKSWCRIAAIVPSLDFLAYDETFYVVERSLSDTGPAVKVEELVTRSNVGYGSGVDVVSEDTEWLQQYAP